ncbi:dicarboxylate/amino acid:cation symporter [Rhizosphaericola mali]|uniref:Dicarboxylate/amino acid:cation symporter n=1 Tax=Rhizosphaericola mali TaxID=2545455 RepID=A0A5P2G1U2_9BACT|nr:dicarboxylate/amino acid:cation symporter [Rhizosphaericola mali]QES89776.1 dicarboxylate/amino acid:cation symporter [Rhizosphaericola mali]
MTKNNFLKNYGSSLILLSGLVVGCLLGVIFGPKIQIVKPLGDIFLNLLFIAVVPLIFFTIANSIANIESKETKMGKLFLVTIFVFILTVVIAAILTTIGVFLFPIPQPAIPLQKVNTEEVSNLGDQITSMLTVDNFYKLLSKGNMLALMIFSALMGFAIRKSGEKGQAFKAFIQSGNEVMTQFLGLIMKIAPFGLGAYMATQISTLGPQMFGIYGHALAIYHGVGIIYMLVFFSLYAFIWGGRKMIRIYWKNNIIPTITAVGTCSSIASIPINLEAAEKMGISPFIRNIVITLGGVLHKEGSSISSIIKIATVFAVLHKPYTGMDTITSAILITIIVSMVEGGVPNGGYLGEILFISVYKLPAETLTVAMAIGTLVDPFATILNVTGDTASGMLISRIMDGKRKYTDKELAN